MQILPSILIAGVFVIVSCKDEHKDVVNVTIDKEIVPTMVTSDVETLISDSGIIRYRITAPLWYVFEESKVPKWVFPKGMVLQKYDDFNNVDATVKCDSATYLSKRRLWELDGYVSMMNIEKDKFLTEQLFWDQEKRRVYSDSFIHIERQDRIIEGYGFDSNDRLTEYTVLNPTGIFPVSDIKKGEDKDSVAKDSVVKKDIPKNVEAEPKARQLRFPTKPLPVNENKGEKVDFKLMKTEK